MKQFDGFPARMDFTPIPNLFLNVVLPQIEDTNELHLSLHLFRLLYVKRGYPRFIARGDMMTDSSLKKSLRIEGNFTATLDKALAAAAARGTFISVRLDADSGGEDIYFLNTGANRQVIEKIKRGEIEISGLRPAPDGGEIPVEPPDIFSLYEQNIGMLTPIIAEQLLEAERDYPADWLRDAITEAVTNNKRNWRYITRILESWQTRGKSSGAYRRHTKEGDPDRFVRGKYGHVVRR